MTAPMSEFDEKRVTVGGDDIFVRTAGRGPPLLLLHGYPQTSVMWHQVATPLIDQHTVIAPDLPGYGRSDAPDGGPARYSKRRIAADMVALMELLGYGRFAVVGHDRGGRVGYRLSLDHPQRVLALAVLDIVPTGVLWANFTVNRALTYYHWLFLAQPSPLPEMLIGHDPGGFLDHTMASWTKAGDLSAFDPLAMADYRECFADPAHLRASCEDYRAGATIDRVDDEASFANGETIGCPTLVLWGNAFSAGDGRPPLEAWRPLAPDATGRGIDAGHFICEENPAAVLAALQPFLVQHVPRPR
ncbi:MAG: alpha/beta hydrolase [Pseudomonadota bacterium]